MANGPQLACLPNLKNYKLARPSQLEEVLQASIRECGGVLHGWEHEDGQIYAFSVALARRVPIGLTERLHGMNMGGAPLFSDRALQIGLREGATELKFSPLWPPM